MYTHAPRDYTCPFCLLVQGTENPHVRSVQSDILHHDNRLTAFISLHQWANNPANAIIVPNAHYENIFDLPLDYAREIHRLAKSLAFAMKTVYACDGISTRQHNEPAGNQDVWHYHLHVTPRYRNDQFYTTQPGVMLVEERARHAHLLQEALAVRILDE